MRNSYINLFAEAIARTAKYKMELPAEDILSIGKNKNHYSDHETQIGVGHYIHNILKFTPEEIAAQCLKFSMLSKPLIDEYLGIKTILTIGYVIDNGQERFKFGDTDIESMINKSPQKYPFKKGNFHVWLTLPSLEIFDLTFRESKNFVNGSPFDSERGFDFILNTIESLYLKQKLVYVPMLVGNDSVYKLGLVDHEPSSIHS